MRREVLKDPLDPHAGDRAPRRNGRGPTMRTRCPDCLAALYVTDDEDPDRVIVNHVQRTCPAKHPEVRS